MQPSALLESDPTTSRGEERPVVRSLSFINPTVEEFLRRIGEKSLRIGADSREDGAATVENCPRYRPTILRTGEIRKVKPI